MIFVSHSLFDKQNARQLALKLSLNGGHVWLDEGNIRAGDNLDEKLLRAIEESNIFLYLVSNNSFASEWVQKELRHAIKCSVKIIPILLDGSTIEEMPQEIQANAALKVSDGYSYVASKVLDVARELGGNSPKSLQVWFRDESLLQHSLDLLSKDGINVESTHLLTREYKNLLEELQVAGEPDLSWLGSDEDEHARLWRLWVKNLSHRVHKVATIVPKIAQTYVSAGSASHQGKFLKNASEEAILTLVRLLMRALKKVQHLANPSVASEDELRTMSAAIPMPFGGGITADIAWGSNLGDVVVADCPNYVKKIDLMPGWVRASAVVTADDLGRMFGWCLAHRIWIQASEPDSDQIDLNNSFPEFSELMIAPH